MAHSSVKQTTIDIIKAMPESSSLEEIMYQINLTAQTLSGLDDIKKNKFINSEQLLNNLSKWTAK